MPFDREDTLKKAEKLLRQGRLDSAIAEYLKVVEDQPGDWGTTNTLGDLYVRAGQIDKAAAQYSRIADHFKNEGFYSKAGALYKKLLKLNPRDETSQLSLAEVSHKQGLLVDAKAHLNAVAAQRRSRGDQTGAASIVVQLGSIDPADFEARKLAARTLFEMGDTEAATARFRAIHDDLVAKKRRREALEVLQESVRLNPHDRLGRTVFARAAIADGDVELARMYLDLETAADDLELLTALVELELKSNHLDRARQLVPKLLAAGASDKQRALDLAWTMAAATPEAAYVLVEAAVDAISAAREYKDAAATLQEFLSRAPDHVPGLIKLIEVSVDGELEEMMCHAQGQLADAYLKAGHATEARVVAEDLVAREPWDRAHIDRFRRALVMLKVSEPDTVIAERLSGETPFVATDPFAGVTARPDPRADQSPSPVIETPAMAAPETAPAPVTTVTPPAPPRQPPVAEPEADDDNEEEIEIDLTGALGSAGDDVRQGSHGRATDDAAPDSLEEVFAGIRSQVQRQSGDYPSQHMTLARTYLEMDMPDKALASLEIASRAPGFRFEAATLLGRIYMGRGNNVRAIEWLERAAEAPPPTVEAGRALLYDLGALLEATGETSRALAIFLELQTEAGEYRDAADRIGRLSRVETGG